MEERHLQANAQMSISKLKISPLFSTLRRRIAYVSVPIWECIHESETIHARQVNLEVPGPDQQLVDGIEEIFRKGWLIYIKMFRYKC